MLHYVSRLNSIEAYSLSLHHLSESDSTELDSIPLEYPQP
jgi:hypothetical protein